MTKITEIKTEFRGGEYAEKYGLSGDDLFVKTKLEKYLRVNRGVKKFTEEESVATAEKLSGLEKDGLRGIVHLISSPVTSEMLRRAIPRELSSHICEVYYQVEGRDEVSTVEKFRDNIIHVSLDGEITSGNKNKLESLFSDRVGILISGGSGYPTEPSRKSLLKALEKPIQNKTALAGICLGHQDLGALNGSELLRGVVDAGTQIERATEAGKKHPVISRLCGDSGDELYGAAMFNSCVVVPGTRTEVLSEGVSTGHKPITVSFDLAYEGQGLGTQAHPEITAGDGIKTTEEKKIEIAGELIKVPKGTSADLAKIISYAAKFWEIFYSLGVTVPDLQNVILKERMYPTIGQNYFGPLIDWMANLRRF